MGGFGGCLDNRLGDTMPGGRLLGDTMGHSMSGGRGSTSDPERDELVARDSDIKLKETGSEPSKPALVVQMASIILYGCQALPVRLKILLDRLLSVLTREEVMQLLIGFGWTYEDYYKRGYKLQDRSGQILHKWHLMTDEEESLILRQFLHFSETKTIAKQLLNDDATQENKFNENIRESRETYQKSTYNRNPKVETVTVEPSESLENIKYEMKEKGKYERTDNFTRNEGAHPNNHDSMDYKEHKQSFSKMTPLNYNLLEHNNNLNAQVKNLFERSNTFLKPLPQSTPSNIFQSLPASGHTRFPGVSPSLAGMSGRGNILRGSSFNSPMLTKSQLSNLFPHSFPPYPYSQIAPKLPHSLSSSAPLDPSINHLKNMQAFQKRYNAFNPDNISKPFTMNSVKSPEIAKPIVSNNINLYANNTLEKSMGADQSKSSSALDLSSSDNMSVTNKDSHDNILSGSPVKRSWNSIDNPASFINPLTGKKRVQCSVCLKTFCDKGALKIHFSAVHLREMHKCFVEGCTMMFSSKRSRNRHSANPSPKLHTPHIRRKISPHDGRIAHHALLTPGHPPSSYQALPGYPLGAFTNPFGPHSSLPFTPHGLLGSQSLQQQAMNIQHHRMNESTDRNYRVSDWHSPMYTEDISTTSYTHDSGLSVEETEDSRSCDRDSFKETNSPSDESENKRKRKSLKPTKLAFRIEDDNLILTDDDEDDDGDDTDTKDSTEDKELDAMSDCDEVPSVDVNQIDGIEIEKSVCENKNDTSQSKVSSSSYDDSQCSQNPLQQLEDLSKGNLGHITNQGIPDDIQCTSSQVSATVNKVTSSSPSHSEYSYDRKNNGETNEGEDNYLHTCTVNGCNAAFPSKRSCDRHVSNINLHRKLLSTIPDFPSSVGVGPYGSPYNPLLNPELISHLYSNPLNPLLPNLLSHFAAMKHVSKTDDPNSSGNISPHSTTPNTLGTINSDIPKNSSSPTVQRKNSSPLPEEANEDKPSHTNESNTTEEETVVTAMET
ncbi:unnamed protein product [Meganyctiphanes norvegica]|uniref:C2H2-type domain-containing protein n=1 Tax=Meganyctiphanes norvegica TaxID=48144 RepID=A0AAV2SWD7_MEGNR